MSNHFDAMREVMQDAEEKVLAAGLSGGDVHAQVDQATVMMATMSWAVREIKDSNVKLAKELTGNGDHTVRNRIKKGGPAAGAGAAVVAFLAYLREWF